YPTDPTKADTDGDGFNDSIESHYASDPNNAAVTPNTIRPAGRVLGWGNGGTYTNGFTNVIQVSAGEYHFLGLRADGTVFGWGDNSQGQLNLPTFAKPVVSVSACSVSFHNLALLADGTVRGWGLNNYGQASIPAGLSNVVAVSGGREHSLVLKADGTVLAWGNNNVGQASVPAGLTNVIKIAAGPWHNLALKRDGTVVRWGATSMPNYQVPAGLTNVVDIAAAHNTSMALKRDGTLVVWGKTSWDGTDSGMDVLPADLGTVRAIGTTYNVAMAVKMNGDLVKWGNGIWADNKYFGNLHNVPSYLREVVAFAGGLLDSAAITTGPLQQPPTIGLNPNPISFSEGAAGRTVGTVTLADPDGNAADLIVSVGGLDASYFSISGTGATRNLVTSVPTDYESGKSSFSLSLTVTDVQGLSATVNATASLLDDRNEDADGDGLTEQQEEDTYGTSDLLTDT
ncbi:MAG: hypothetical protein EBZ78_12525, partial [Verrucomicrobia bacterium]|nr:hypothetical protein [Verrucomicrobiota bacterium]